MSIYKYIMLLVSMLFISSGDCISEDLLLSDNASEQLKTSGNDLQLPTDDLLFDDIRWLEHWHEHHMKLLVEYEHKIASVVILVDEADSIRL